MMKLKKIWRWTKIAYGLIFIFAIVVLISVLGIIMTGVLRDQQALQNTVTINSITLVMALLSLPGVLVQLTSLLFINEKKTFTATKKCPNCRQLVDIKLTED
jgi:hypothetical protein